MRSANASRPPQEIELRSSFGEAVRRLRTASNITQEALADLADLSVSHVSLLERGKRTATLYSAARIAFVLGMPLSQLVAQAEGEMPRA